MSKIAFPAGLTIDFHNVNMEEMEYYARAWNLQRIQMGKGKFVGSMIATHTPRMQLMRSPYSHGVLLQGDFPKGTILIAYVITNADVTFQNKVGDKHEIKILRSGDEIDFLCNGDSETFTVAVEEKYFYEAYYAYFQEDFLSGNKEKSIYIKPKYMEYFSQGIERWMHYLMAERDIPFVQTQYDTIEFNILEHIFSCIYTEETIKERQKFEVNKVRDLLHASINEPNTIMHLAQKLDISERSLHHLFKINYGITPKQYFMALRMHHIKEELFLSPAETSKISKIIEKYQYFNPSTFTQAYKHMFGELPSQTLQESVLN